MANNLYEHDSLPEDGFLFYHDVPVIPKGMFKLAYDAFIEAYEGDFEVAKEARVAYIYDRKGSMAFDPVDKRNASYGSKEDDLIIQLTLRIDGNLLVRSKFKDSAPVSLINEIKRQSAEAERMEIEEANTRDAKEVQRLLDTIKSRENRLKDLS